MAKVAGRTPAGLLLIPPDLVKDNLIIQCPHISINISGRMGKASKRVVIAASRYPGTRKSPQWIAVCAGETMDARNDIVGQYQR